MFAIHFPSYTKRVSAVYTKLSSKHSNTEHLSGGFLAQSIENKPTMRIKLWGVSYPY